MRKVITFLIILCVFLVNVSFADEIDVREIENENDYTLLENYETFNLYAKVIEAGEQETINDGYTSYIVQKIKVKILDKRFKDKEFEIINYLEDGINSNLPLYEKLKVGDKVYVYGIYENNKLDVSAVSYYDKTPWILGLLIIFLLSIVIIGGKNGVKAIIGLLLTIALIFGFLIPGILAGKNIILLTIIICTLVIVLTFLIISGFKKKTYVAIIGTVGGIVMAAVIGAIFSNLMRLTGINEHARMISVAIEAGRKMISFKDVMLSAIMVSAMGACMDVGMSISSALQEIKSKRNDISYKELIKSGLNIGKDVMGTMTNTLILAYVGSAMLCILLYNVNGFDLSFVLNAEDITDEILKSMAGSMGLIATIPITAIVGGLLIGNEKPDKVEKKEENEEIPVNYFKG